MMLSGLTSKLSNRILRIAEDVSGSGICLESVTAEGSSCDDTSESSNLQVLLTDKN